MGFHHVAIAAKDIEASHEFYTEAMGFELVKAVVAPTESPGGWAKHLFYETGGNGLLALWDIHDDAVGDSWSPAISTGLGLPIFINHLAFDAADLDDLGARRERWLDLGMDVMEIDHGFCTSIYTTDPNGILVEWCTDTAGIQPGDREKALALLADPAPALEEPPAPVFHRGRKPVTTPAPAPVPAT